MLKVLASCAIGDSANLSSTEFISLERKQMILITTALNYIIAPLNDGCTVIER